MEATWLFVTQTQKPHRNTSTVSYSVGQSSHKPIQIQGEGTKILPFSRQSDKESDTIPRMPPDAILNGGDLEEEIGRAGLCKVNFRN